MNMFSHKNKFHVVTALSAVTAAIAVALLRFISLYNYYDSAMGYYERDAALPVIFTALAAVAVIGFGAFCVFGMKKCELAIPRAGGVCRVTALLPVAAFALLCWNRWQTFTALEGLAAPQLIWALLAPLLALGVLVFFVSACIGLEPTWLTGLSGVLSILMFAYELSTVYTDMTIAMNSPNKLLLSFALLSAMIYILAELRVIFKAQKPRLYLFSLFASTLLTGAYSIPAVIISLVDGNRPGDIDIALLTFFIFLVARGVSLAFLPEKDIADTADATEDAEVAEVGEDTENIENTEDTEITENDETSTSQE